MQPTQKVKTVPIYHPAHHTTQRVIALFLAVVIMLSPLSVLPVLAQDYSSQVNSVQSEINSYQAAQVRLNNYADNLEAALQQSNDQLRDVQAQIALNQAKYDALTSELIYRASDVKAKSNQVGSVIRANYVDTDISSVELFAASGSLSDYIDRFEYRDRLGSQLQSSLRQLTTAQDQVKAQQQEVDKILRDGKAMRDTLVKKTEEQNELLSRTRGQQAAYTKLISERNANIATLRANQLSANQTAFSGGELVAGDPNKGGYPAKWADADQDSLVDDWGLYNRECVSYTAWKVEQSGKRMPYWGGRGNANQWPSSAQADGIATGNEPRKGAVAIALIGPYGHAMYVEDVLAGGKIRISEFNYYVTGTYTERIVSGANLTYIYF